MAWCQHNQPKERGCAMLFFTSLLILVTMTMVATASNQWPRVYHLNGGSEQKLVMASDLDSRGRPTRYGRRCMSYLDEAGKPSHDGSLPDGPLHVGMRWQHTYRVVIKPPCLDVEEYSRTRVCEARSASTLHYSGHDVQVIMVECQNLRTGRNLPQTEYLTFTLEGNILLIERVSWGGIMPGGGEWRLESSR